MFRSACLLLLLLIVGCGGASESTSTKSEKMGDTLEQNFRTRLGPGFRTFGDGTGASTRIDRLGMRISLAPTRKAEDGVGVATRFRISGDFEVTLSYAVLSTEQPKNGFGAGAKTWLKIGDHPQRNVTFAHFRRPKSDNQLVALVTTFDEQKNKSFDQKTSDASETRGKLRLERTGTLLRFLIAEEDSNQFREIHQADVGREDVQAIRIQATSSGAPVPVSVRFGDLKIRADKLSIQGSPPQVQNRTHWFWWGALIAAIGIVSAFLLRRRAWPGGSGIRRCPGT